MSPEEKKGQADWEKELDGLLGEINEASGAVEMRKLETDSDGDPAQNGDEESAAAAHRDSVTDSVFASDIEHFEEITSGAEAEPDGEDLADTRELAAAARIAPPPDEKPDRDEGAKSEFSLAAGQLFSKMVAEAKATDHAPPGDEVPEAPGAADDRADADEFTDAVSGMFQDVARRAESLVRRVSSLEAEREDLSRRAGEAEGAAEREIARSQALEERLKELEKIRAQALSRIRELEADLAEQVDVVMQEKIDRLGAKLVEAYDVIKVIEDAYLAGEGRA